MQIEYVCRCGKLSYSLFQQKRHVKSECHLKHVAVETTGKCFSIVEPTPPKAKK
jgi:hypothetical protein